MRQVSEPNARPTTTLRPTNLAEAAAALADTTGKVLIQGAGTAADWAGRPEAPDLVLDTTGLAGVLAHNPSDMTVEVRAGTPLRSLNAELAGHGQRVALDAARVADGATVGGLLATADSGPAALTYGSMRDLVIGAVVVLADGTVARTGGHVIKNVAGYDLAKLVHGAYGTLAVAAEVVLRLHPLPAASATVRLPCSLLDAGAAAETVLASPLEPAALEWCGGGLLVRLEGGPAALDARTARLGALLGSAARRLDDAEAGAAWADHAASVSRPPDRAGVLRVGTRPSRLSRLLDRLADTPGAGPVTAGLATGIGSVTLPADSAVIAEAHRAVHAAGGVSVLRSRPDGADLPAWGPAPSALGLLRSVRDELDPNGRLGSGRFAPWLDARGRCGP